jgi:hypothetical protein
MTAQPDAHGGELDGGEEVFRVLVAAGRDASEVFDLVEERFDAVASAISSGALAMSLS